jgi:putative DNA primase/helicase
MTNYDSVLAQLRAAGLIIDGLTIGRMQRCKTEGDRERRGWYSLHEVINNQGEPILVGSYGVWRGNDNNAQKIEVDRKTLSAEQADALKKRIAEDRKRAEAERQRAADRAAAEASRVWRAYRPGDGQSAYLAEKGVKAHGLRWAPAENGTFAIPMMDTAGKVWGLQIIRDEKREGKLQKEYFPRGLAKKGKYHTLGTIRDLVLIAEGYATAATLHESTGLPVVVAFDAGNLQPVAEAIHKAYPRVQILVCADDDYLTPGNPGFAAATNAALAVGGAWVKPEFVTDRQGKKLTDFNDLAALDGAQQVQACIQAAVAKMPQARRAAAVLARGSTPEGGGESQTGMVSRISIDEAAARYWGTYGLGGDVLFDEVERRLVHKKDVVNLLPRHGWETLKDHPDWRVARDTEIGFDPTEADKQIKCNLFGGWPTTPKAGTCTKLLELLEWLCANETNDQEVYRWILKWLAYPIQHRGAKMHSAIVVHGPQGTGKSRFFEAYAKIFGPYGRVLGQEALEDKFNADWAEKKLFILADEVLARSDMYHIKNRLKGFITGDTIRVNPKNVAAHNEKNQMNLVFLSNERQPLVLENDDRRHCVIWVPPKLPDDFFAAVNAEIDAGGIEALHHYLLELDLGDFKPWTKPPMTKAKQDLVVLGKSSEERFLHEWIAGELEAPDGDILPFAPCLGSHLYRAYEAWCDRHGERKRGMKDLISLAGKQPGWSAGAASPTWTTLQDRTIRNRKMIVPGEMQIVNPTYQRDRFSSKAEWLTAGYFAFETALGVTQ